MNENRKIPKGIHLIIGGVFKNPGRTVVITSTYCQEILELACSVHEEADTMMFAHLNYSVCTMNCIIGVICSIDTNVIVLAIYYCVRIPGLTKLWIQKNDTYLPLHSIVHDYAHSLECENELLTGILLSGYILTGCDIAAFLKEK